MATKSGEKSRKEVKLSVEALKRFKTVEDAAFKAINELAARLTALGDDHAGVHFASRGWILPQLHDPDGHEVRFYTIEHHTDPQPPGITTIRDPRESSERRERAYHAENLAGRRNVLVPRLVRFARSGVGVTGAPRLRCGWPGDR